MMKAAPLLVFGLSLTLAAPAIAAGAPKTSGEKAVLTPEEKSFVLKANQINLQEVKLGDLAEKKGQSSDVKGFGERMVKDHGQAEDQLKALAHDKDVSLPSAVDAEGKATFNKLNKFSGAAFDKEYISAMASGHKQALELFQAQEKKTADKQLKDWIGKTAPVVEQHMKSAEEIKSKLK